MAAAVLEACTIERSVEAVSFACTLSNWPFPEALKRRLFRTVCYGGWETRPQAMSSGCVQHCWLFWGNLSSPIVCCFGKWHLSCYWCRSPWLIIILTQKETVELEDQTDSSECNSFVLNIVIGEIGNFYYLFVKY